MKDTKTLLKQFDDAKELIMSSPLRCPHCEATENISKQQLSLYQNNDGIIYQATARLLCETCGNIFKFALDLNWKSGA